MGGAKVVIYGLSTEGYALACQMALKGADVHIIDESTPSAISLKESPDIVISFCSPEAARISFGMGIKHIAFNDSPHATAVMKLSIPFVDRLLTPWIIPKKEFMQFGIKSSNIIHYKAIDAAYIAKRKITINPLPKNNKKTILIRIAEEQASYITKKIEVASIIKKIIESFDNEFIIVLGRYLSQIKKLKQTFGNKVKIIEMPIDGKLLLKNVDVFIGSGGTMTAESALLGIPTISYNAVPNLIEDYLVRNKLVKRESEPKKIIRIVNQFLKSSGKEQQKKAKKMLEQMEDPYVTLVRVMKNL